MIVMRTRTESTDVSQGTMDDARCPRCEHTREEGSPPAYVRVFSKMFGRRYIRTCWGDPEQTSEWGDGPCMCSDQFHLHAL